MQQHPHDLAAAWLAQAEADLESARWTLEGRRYDTTCFIAQQAAEKALKAALILAAGSKPRTHVLARLVAELAETDAEAATRLDEVVGLDVFYTASRYPDAIGGAIPAATFKRQEAELALGRADAAVAYARERLDR